MLKFLTFFFVSVFVSGVYSLPALAFSKANNVTTCQSCDADHDRSSDNSDNSDSDDGFPCESEEVQEEEAQEPSLLSEFNFSHFRNGKTSFYHFPQLVFYSPFLNICSPPPESLSFSLRA